MNIGLNYSLRKLYSATNFLLISNLIKCSHVDKLRISKVIVVGDLLSMPINSRIFIYFFVGIWSRQ